ncbi:hypothetical protein V7128_20150, partial [Neobacillus vireti]|uniref:hypothetical protein n=1 Tax=Neobacillus vireti TaxID=220686 RepID=UPI002FFFEDB5
SIEKVIFCPISLTTSEIKCLIIIFILELIEISFITSCITLDDLHGELLSHNKTASTEAVYFLSSC